MNLFIICNYFYPPFQTASFSLCCIHTYVCSGLYVNRHFDKGQRPKTSVIFLLLGTGVVLVLFYIYPIVPYARAFLHSSCYLYLMIVIQMDVVMAMIQTLFRHMRLPRNQQAYNTCAECVLNFVCGSYVLQTSKTSCTYVL